MTTASDDLPDFQLRLPHGGPVATGRLLPEAGSNGSRKFLILAGSPARADVVASFPTRCAASHRQREELVADGTIRKTDRWPNALEVTADIVCGAPTGAAEILIGRSANGWTKWQTAEGRPLSDYMEGVWMGPKRPWLVRGAHILGLDPVADVWLPRGVVSLSATRLPIGVEHGESRETLRRYVEDAYASSESYAGQQQLVDDFHNFLSRMHVGDTVCTVAGGHVLLGKITGPAVQVESDSGRTTLERPVEWQSGRYTLGDLPEEVKQKLSTHRDVVDLTSVQALIDGLGRSNEELEAEAHSDSLDAGSAELATLTARRELELPQPTEELADELHLHDVSWLHEIRELLVDERQIVLYGPPGTGKTFLAQAIAEFLGGGPEQVKLVQFHPSYAYEDFFEGFRPQKNRDTGEVAFQLTAGPLRELADLASREGHRHIPYFLIIDEINRAHLAKVFGELYFLLEYRDKSVRLTYSGDDFGLPPNLFVIGTMNTADRSIALLDAAMRRRFAFVELSPRIEPTVGLLRRRLAATGMDSEPADLLDALNARIDDPDFRIGPSYLMKKGTYREGGLERTWRTKILPLLEEHHYGLAIDVEARYGLPALRRSIHQARQLARDTERPLPVEDFDIVTQREVR